MPALIRNYVKIVDTMNRFIGRVMMYGLFVMMAILLWSSLSKAIFVVPAFWTLETAQFALVAYYLVGGPRPFPRYNLIEVLESSIK